MKRFLLILILLMPAVPFRASGEPLVVSYLDRPPYYFTNAAGMPDGFLVDLTKRIFLDAGIEASFKELPPNRIMYELKKKNTPHCSIGWIKTPEREKFAVFSLPIYQDRPIAIVTTRANGHRFFSYTRLSQVFSDTSLILATVSSFSYGTYIDELREIHSPRFHEVSTERSILPQLIVMKRATYLLSAPEEVAGLLSSAGVKQEDFITIPMQDVPSGNTRCLVFSRAVDEKSILRINDSIRKIAGQSISGTDALPSSGIKPKK